MERFVGKVALVTGAAAGIGAGVSRRLAQDGIAVGVLDISIDDAGRVANEINGAGGHAIALEASIADRPQVDAAVSKLRQTFGRIGIVVNNAGIFDVTPFLELTDAKWDQMLEINLKGAVIVTQAVLPDMVEAGWGRIINISSAAAQSGVAQMGHYAAAKGGMIALTKSLAHEFGPQGVTSNAIAPRFIHNTVMSNASFALPELQPLFESEIQGGPIRRHGEPEDIASACAYLSSDEAGYVTGQLLAVNGGRYI